MIMEYNILPILLSILVGIVVVDLLVASVWVLIVCVTKLVVRYREYRNENPRRKKK